MKITVFFLLLISNLVNSQSLHIIYSNKNSKYTTFQEHLFISKNNIISIRDSIVKNSFDEKKAIDGNTNQSIFFTKEKLHQIIYFKNDKDKVIFKDYIESSSYYVEDYFPEIKWNTNYSEIKTIAGYACKKASAEFRGSKIIAYYTNELNYKTGPFKFSGLDGLILEITEENNNEYNSWIATEVELNHNQTLPVLSKEATAITLKQFLELKEKKKEEDFNKMIGGAPAGTVITKHKIQRNGIEKTYEWE